MTPAMTPAITDAGDHRRAILRFLADLTRGKERSRPIAVPRRSFHPIGEPTVAAMLLGVEDDAALPRWVAENLLVLNQLRPDSNALSAGLLFVHGSGDTDGASGTFRLPVFRAPIEIHETRRGHVAGLAGDVEVDPFFDEGLRNELEEAYALATAPMVDDDPDTTAGNAPPDGTLPDHASPPRPATGSVPDRLAFLADRVEALLRGAGVDVTERSDDPGDGPSRPLTLWEVGAVFCTELWARGGVSGHLQRWSQAEPEGQTAFDHMYRSDHGASDEPGLRPPPPGAASRIHSPFELTDRQAEAVIAARSYPVSVIAGAPGTGKSHTIVAVVTDALARGERVLVAAKHDDAVDSLFELFERAPGPQPVAFGSNRRTRTMADTLATEWSTPLHDDQVDRLRAEAEQAWADHDRQWRVIADALRAAGPAPPDEPAARVDAPGAFDADADLNRLAALAAEAAEVPTGWWSRRRVRRRGEDLRERLRADPRAPVAELSRAVEVARLARQRVHLVAAGGLAVADDIARLASMSATARAASARWLATEARRASRWSRADQDAVAQVASALRAVRSTRRRRLAPLGRELRNPLPLWIGTTSDVEDLLPRHPAMFDLVVIDEAASLDQGTAAGTWLRGRRAVVVGDPKQLRHVSFLSDDRLQRAIDAHSLDDQPVLAARLDLRRTSAFDAAASVAPVRVLDEHFRSDPHLFDFVARRLYDDAVAVATRRPSTDSVDRVHHVHLPGARDDDGVVSCQIDFILDRLREAASEGRRGLGVITPFRAQADALEAGILARLTTDEILGLDLRLGTVHAFQGGERDEVIVALGAGDDATGNTWRFVDDPHLFAVMVTRARRDLTMLSSGTPPHGGLVADYLVASDRPPRPPESAPPTDRWVRDVAERLADAGIGTIAGYPTGHHVVDLAVADRDLAVEATIHPDGPDAHIRRHLELLTTGWEILEAHRSRWEERTGELALHIADQVAASTAPGRAR